MTNPHPTSTTARIARARDLIAQARAVMNKYQGETE